LPQLNERAPEPAYATTLELDEPTMNPMRASEGSAYGTTRWTGLPRTLTRQVVVSLPTEPGANV